MIRSRAVSPAWHSLADSLHLLFQRLPIPDPRRPRVNTAALTANDCGLQAIGRQDDDLAAQLQALAGRVATIDTSDHAAFAALMGEIEALAPN